MNANELLTHSLDADAATRQNATQSLERAAAENFPAYMLMLSAELSNEEAQVHIRNAAGIAMKNALSAREVERQQDYHTRWLALDIDTRGKIKQDSLMTLGSPAQRAGSTAAQVVAAIAAVELPADQWKDLIELLLGFVNNQENVNARVSTLQAIGYICESIKPDIMVSRSNEILTVVIQGARKEEPSSEVQIAAINALYNSLEFVRDNFEREGERNYIMQVVCEATQSVTHQVQVGAFECLVRIMSLYYDKMSFYMERALFGLTVLGMKSQDESVALQAVEFWSTVCEEEIELAIEAAEAMEYGEVPDIESKNFARIALPEIIPVLLQLLTQQDEDADEDEWNVSMAAGTCLSLLAQAVGDTIVSAVVPFIEAHIKSEDWHQREAAVMTFGSILDGPDPNVLNPLVNSALPVLIDMMQDPNMQVKDTTAWTLGRICDLLINTIKPDVHLHPLVSALVAGLQDRPRIIANSCWALMNLADQLGSYYEDESVPNPQPGPLSPYYEGIVGALLRVTETSGNEANFRTSAYETLGVFMTHATPDVIPVVQNTVVAILSRIEQLLGMQNQILGMDDRNNWNDLQSNLCGVVTAVIRKLNAGIQPLADRTMELMLQLLQAAGKASGVMEDVFHVAGALASTLESGFAPYMPTFLPFLYPALKAYEDPHLCTTAIGIIGDITRGLGPQSALYASAFMTVLLENLQSDTLNRNVKIPILTCFGDIALAIGEQFEPYLDTTMGVLRQAGQIQPSPIDYELTDYVSQLRDGILEAYTGIVSAFRGTRQDLLLPHASSVLEVVQRCMNDEERGDTTVRLSIGLIGDLADTFSGGQIKQLLLAEWVAQALRPRGRSAEVKKTARWAREMVKRATA